MSQLYIAIVVLLVHVAAAQNQFTNEAYNLVVDVPFDITWTPTTPGTVSLILLTGDSSDLENVATIAAHISNSGSYTWTPSISIVPSDKYVIRIQSDENKLETSYTPYFTIANTAGDVGSSSASPAITSAGPTVPIATDNGVSVATPSVSDGVVGSSTSDASVSTVTSAPTSGQPHGGNTTEQEVSTTTVSSLPSATTKSTSGLSSGAAAGIGVGATLGVIIIAVVAYFLWRKYRRSSPKSHLGAPIGPLENVAPGSDKGAVELGATTESVAELGGTTKSVAELGGITKLVAKLPGTSNSVAELRGTTRSVAELGGNPRAELDS